MGKLYDPFSLKGKVILVTGASSGIGRQCAIDCSKMGAKVVAVARNKERLEETLAQMEGDGHHCYSFDLLNTGDVGAFLSTVVSDCGRLSGMVYAAGVEKTLPFKLLKPSDYEGLLKINTIGAFEFARAVCNYKNFNNSSGGSIVFIASIAASIARNGTAAYSASKGALVSAARVLASELSEKKIRVNCVSPGTVLTPMMQKYLDTLPEEEYNKRIAGFPLGLGETSDISNACVFLLSGASRWMTGQNLVIDGGYTVR